MLLASVKMRDIAEDAPISIALFALQLTLLLILVLMCIGLGVETSLKDSGIKFEILIALGCLIDCLVYRRLYSIYSTLTCYRLVGSLQKVVRLKQYQIAVEFMTNIASIALYFLVLTVTLQIT